MIFYALKKLLTNLSVITSSMSSVMKALIDKEDPFDENTFK